MIQPSFYLLTGAADYFQEYGNYGNYEQKVNKPPGMITQKANGPGYNQDHSNKIQ
jgi:hypothetical protein